MKNAIIPFVLIIICIVSVFGYQAIQGDTIRQNELKTSVTNAVEQTVASVRNKKYSSNTEMTSSFMSNLKKQTSTKGNYKVEILDVDATYGLLSVKVSQTYTHNGKTKTISFSKTGILDGKENSSETKNND